MTYQCKDFDEFGNMADPRYTMDYTDVKLGALIYWCAPCGEMWTPIAEALEAHLKDDKAFAEQFEAAMDKVCQ